MKSFGAAAEPTLEQFRENCSGSYKEMMVQLGIFSPTENDLITERQVIMAAMALAVKEGARPTPEIMGNDGNIDLLKVVSLEQTTLFTIMEEMGIDKEMMDRAKVFAENASINDVQNFCDIPMIGRIQSEYLGRPDLVQAALALQHSVHAANIMHRLQNGEPDKEDYNRRREFSYADLSEDERLEDAVGLHYQLSVIEKEEATPGDKMDMSQHFDAIRSAFQTTVGMFDEAARGEKYSGPSPKLIKLTDRIQDLANHCLERIGANEPMAFDLGRELERGEIDPLTDPNFEIPGFLRTGPDRGDRDLG